jgi:hypothetical protein
VFEEMVLPISYTADRAKDESILLEVAKRHTVHETEIGHEALEEMRRRYFMERASTEPRVYWRLTDNWLELTVRFVTREHGVRDVKDRMSREILRELDAAGIGLASATFEIVGLPKVQLSLDSTQPA